MLKSINITAVYHDHVSYNHQLISRGMAGNLKNKKNATMVYSGPLFAVFPGMQTPLTSIKGIIIPASWDTNGTILSTAIVTFTEDMFAVTDSDCGRSLTRHLRETVTVTGRVSVHGSSKHIHVQDFQIHGKGERA